MNKINKINKTIIKPKEGGYGGNWFPPLEVHTTT